MASSLQLLLLLVDLDVPRNDSRTNSGVYENDDDAEELFAAATSRLLFCCSSSAATAATSPSLE